MEKRKSRSCLREATMDFQSISIVFWMCTTLMMKALAGFIPYPLLMILMMVPFGVRQLQVGLLLPFTSLIYLPLIQVVLFTNQLSHRLGATPAGSISDCILLSPIISDSIPFVFPFCSHIAIVWPLQ